MMYMRLNSKACGIIDASGRAIAAFTLSVSAMLRPTAVAQSPRFGHVRASTRTLVNVLITKHVRSSIIPTACAQRYNSEGRAACRWWVQLHSSKPQEDGRAHLQTTLHVTDLHTTQSNHKSPIKIPFEASQARRTPRNHERGVVRTTSTNTNNPTESLKDCVTHQQHLLALSSWSCRCCCCSCRCTR